MFCVSGIKESDTGLAPPALWDLAADKQTLQSESNKQLIGVKIFVWYVSSILNGHMIVYSLK